MNTELSMPLVAMAAQGQRPACSDLSTRERWTSDDHNEREWAAYRCKGCPVAALCIEDALQAHVTHGVWGGHDLTRMSKSSRSRLRARLATTDDTEPLF